MISRHAWWLAAMQGLQRVRSVFVSETIAEQNKTIHGYQIFGFDHGHLCLRPVVQLKMYYKGLLGSTGYLHVLKFLDELIIKFNTTWHFIGSFSQLAFLDNCFSFYTRVKYIEIKCFLSFEYTIPTAAKICLVCGISKAAWKLLSAESLGLVLSLSLSISLCLSLSLSLSVGLLDTETETHQVSSVEGDKE